MGSLSFDGSEAVGNCGWCGQPTDTVVARVHINNRTITLFAHDANNLDGLSCLQWIAYELDAGTD